MKLSSKNDTIIQPSNQPNTSVAGHLVAKGYMAATCNNHDMICHDHPWSIPVLTACLHSYPPTPLLNGPNWSTHTYGSMISKFPAWWPFVTPARDPKQCGGVGSRCARYKQQQLHGTATNEVGHHRNATMPEELSYKHQCRVCRASSTA